MGGRRECGWLKGSVRWEWGEGVRGRGVVCVGEEGGGGGDGGSGGGVGVEGW